MRIEFSREAKAELPFLVAGREFADGVCDIEPFPDWVDDACARLGMLVENLS